MQQEGCQQGKLRESRRFRSKSRRILNSATGIKFRPACGPLFVGTVAQVVSVNREGTVSIDFSIELADETPHN